MSQASAHRGTNMAAPADDSGSVKDDQTLLASPNDHFLASGWLFKQRDGHIQKGWCRRFLILSETHLWYFHGLNGVLDEVPPPPFWTQACVALSR